MRLGVRGKLFLIMLGLWTLGIVATDLVLARVLSNELMRTIHADLKVRLELAKREVARHAADPAQQWSLLARELASASATRVTIIGADGSVLGDSGLDAEGLSHAENHGSRLEVQRALRGETSVEERWSRSLGRRMLYVATPFAGGALRLAVPLTELDQAVSQLHRRVILAGLFGFALLMALAFIGATQFSARLWTLRDAARKLSSGDLTVRVPEKGGDELAELGRALNRLGERLVEVLGAIQRERDLQRTVLEGMREGVLVLDSEQRVVLANAALRETFDLGEDVAGRSTLELIRHAGLKTILDQAARGEYFGQEELELSSIKPRQLLVHASQLAGRQGVVAVFVDVTELRRLESLRRDFVANVSHELRTPVTAILSASETLGDVLASEGSSTKDFMDIITRNAARLHALIEDLLDLSRIESRGHALELETLRVGEVVAHVITLFTPRALERDITLTAADLGSMPVVRADRRRLEQILSNLIDNALKYVSPGGTVHLDAVPEGRMLRLRVRDTGVGIAPRHLPRLFERFYRVDAGRSRELGGTGLGLSIVKHLVEAQGGQVHVESEVGHGSTFSVTLPLA